ncbi:hypothetical protein AABC73_01845 [Pseudomonas sp. G.S.17]|uniref:hypothetical protein n=1 Tax=Pseudomonas sp. G.S.17 TaxID=3137451 RepID=UPI00311CA366
MATGWLGWSDSEAWAASVPSIFLAWEAKKVFLEMTNPNGPPKKKPSKEMAAKEARMGFRAAAMNRPQDSAASP